MINQKWLYFDGYNDEEICMAQKTTDYKVDFNKNFFDSMLCIKKDIEENGIELEW